MDPELKERFDRLDRRFDGVEQRLDGVEQRLDGVEQRLDGLQKVQATQGRALGELVEVVGHLADEQRRQGKMIAELAAATADAVSRLHNALAEHTQALGELSARFTRMIQLVIEARTEDAERLLSIERRLARLEE